MSKGVPSALPLGALARAAEPPCGAELTTRAMSAAPATQDTLPTTGAATRRSRYVSPSFSAPGASTRLLELSPPPLPAAAAAAEGSTPSTATHWKAPRDGALARQPSSAPAPAVRAAREAAGCALASQLAPVAPPATAATTPPPPDAERSSKSATPRRIRRSARFTRTRPPALGSPGTLDPSASMRTSGTAAATSVTRTDDDT